jgi:hypothetical protein
MLNKKSKKEMIIYQGLYARIYVLRLRINLVMYSVSEFFFLSHLVIYFY